MLLNKTFLFARFFEKVSHLSNDPTIIFTFLLNYIVRLKIVLYLFTVSSFMFKRNFFVNTSNITVSNLMSYFSFQPVLHDCGMSCLWGGAYERLLAGNWK